MGTSDVQAMAAVAVAVVLVTGLVTVVCLVRRRKLVVIRWYGFGLVLSDEPRGR